MLVEYTFAFVPRVSIALAPKSQCVAPDAGWNFGFENSSVMITFFTISRSPPKPPYSLGYLT